MKSLKKIKKIKRKISKRMDKFISTHPHELGVTNFLYVFMVGIALLYGILIFSMGERLSRIETNVSGNAQQPNVLEDRLRQMTYNFPISRMTPLIAQKDRKVAAYMIAIAKKESNWGRFSPKKEGRECWNFWGYRGPENPTVSGYSCFDSPRQAVGVVGKRIEELVDQDVDTPEEMSVWKCGYDCSWDNPQKVDKWISDVAYYYDKVYQ